MHQKYPYRGVHLFVLRERPHLDVYTLARQRTRGRCGGTVVEEAVGKHAIDRRRAFDLEGRVEGVADAGGAAPGGMRAPVGGAAPKRWRPVAAHRPEPAAEAGVGAVVTREAASAAASRAASSSGVSDTGTPPIEP